jgi:hypothetical protein
MLPNKHIALMGEMLLSRFARLRAYHKHSPVSRFIPIDPQHRVSHYFPLRSRLGHTIPQGRYIFNIKWACVSAFLTADKNIVSP